MTKAVFSFGKESGRSQCFEDSVARYSTTRIDEVVPLLEIAERAALSGAWAVVMISYEAAAAFDAALQTHPPDEFPLVSIEIFREPTDLENFKGTSHERPYEWTPQVSKQEFQFAIDRIRQLIAAGDTYQVNYTFPLTSVFHGDAWSMFAELYDAQRASYCAYLEAERYTILSLSPELFFERKGNVIKTRPMKGTIRRGRWLQEDEELSRQLAASTKDRAENVMIVDLLRNDLGRIAIPGSINVSDLFALERYPTLWQMTSTVTAKLYPEISLKEIFSALFPCGSITGAPKIRTMQIIHDLESTPRHAYTGAIGIIEPGGNCTFNVAIRTVIIDNKTGIATLNVGSGITYESHAEREYDECILKSAFVQKPTTESFSLLESILLEDGELFLLDSHVARLMSSAAFLDFAFDETSVRNQLLSFAKAHRFGKRKVRLLLDKTGEVTITSTELPKLDLPLKVRIAARPINSNDTFLFHKTTHRSLYDAALSFPDCDDVILWNENDEVTESTIANVVVCKDDQFWTPSVSSGLLAGTFREQLLQDGKIRERVIHVDELDHVDQIFLINSVRRWMPAVLLSN